MKNTNIFLLMTYSVKIVAWLEFIEWKVRDGISNKRRRNTIILLQYRSMSSLTAEEKVEYSLQNAKYLRDNFILYKHYKMDRQTGMIDEIKII